MATNSQRPTIVATSGGFDPLHIGHIRLLREAKKLGDKLIVILNNDNWLLFKKGHVFMKERERKEILESIRWVDKVTLTGHTKNTRDISVCRELMKIKPDIFAKGGDRNPAKDPVPEVETCRKIGCRMVYNVGRGGKIQSSSWLLDRFIKNKKYHKL